MTQLLLHEHHRSRGATFATLNGMEVVAHYGDPLGEHACLRNGAGVLDLSFRGRLCLTGADRVRLLNGQVTNDVKLLNPGQGCYAGVVNTKGKLESDANIYCLAEELLLDFEPGLTARLAARFEKYVIADDVQVTDAAPHYGLLSVQGPKSGVVIRSAVPDLALPARLMDSTSAKPETLGEIYCMNHSRARALGFDLFVPVTALPEVVERLLSAAKSVNGGGCGWEALEIARIEAGIPRFGADMDERNLAPEAGIERQAISYTKGCYIGQEVIARLRSYGQVTKALRGLRLDNALKLLPHSDDKLYQGEHEIGYVTSAVYSPALKSNIALAYVRRERNAVGTCLTVRSAAGESQATIVQLPFTD